MSSLPSNPSRTIEYILTSLKPQGILPTKDTEEGRMPKGIQAIMPVQSELSENDLKLAIYTRDIEIRHRSGNGNVTIYASTYIIPTTAPHTMERAEMISIEIERPEYTEFASFEIVGPQAIPNFGHQSCTGVERTGQNYTPEEEALLRPKYPQQVIDWVISEFLCLTR